MDRKRRETWTFLRITELGFGARMDRRRRLHADSTGSDDPDGDRHAKACHLIENVASNLRLGSLIGQSSGLKTPADDGLVAIHCGFGQAAAIVA